MSTEILSRHWSEEDLTTSGIVIGPDLICEALQGYWKAYSTGRAGHKQVRLNFGGDGSKEVAHEAFFHAYSGTKSLHFAPSNGTRNQSTKQVDLTLRNEVTGRHLMSLDGVAIANGRTGWFARKFENLVKLG
nr:Sus [Ipomoea batatas]